MEKPRNDPETLHRLDVSGTKHLIPGTIKIYLGQNGSRVVYAHNDRCYKWQPAKAHRRND